MPPVTPPVRPVCGERHSDIPAGPLPLWAALQHCSIERKQQGAWVGALRASYLPAPPRRIA
eukprot:2362168-Pyramimonas_sp.AAC.1